MRVCVACVTRFVFVFWCVVVCLAWHEDVLPKKTVIIGEKDVPRFYGDSEHPNYFRLLLQDNERIWIGGRNIAYNLNAKDLREKHRLQWMSAEIDKNMCHLKGSSPDMCQNYIRVLVKKEDGNLIVCGTQAFKPKCRDYRKQMDGTFVEEGKVRSGQGLCPADPLHNSTVAYADGALYAGTVADFSGTDSLIYREPLRTEQADLKQINAPDFVSSLEYGDEVFFFFREAAVEYINCGKAIYSRVGRVCKNDKGEKSKNSWTSFLKSRLNCSIPGDFPFYFNEIQSTSRLLYGASKTEVVYAVFNTPRNSIIGSAVCVFNMSELLYTFEGTFKGQETMNSNWLPVLPNKIPEPRPGLCVSNSRTLPDETRNFIKTHPLMDRAAQPHHGAPLLTKTSARYRFTKVEVDGAITAADGQSYDVLFIATDHGHVMKVINTKGALGLISPVIIEDIKVFSSAIPITNLAVVRHGVYEPSLVVVSDDQVVSIPLQRCNFHAGSCSECVRLQDPYCAWDVQSRTCKAIGAPSKIPRGEYVQNIEIGFTLDCSQGRSAVSPVSQPSSSGDKNWNGEAWNMEQESSSNNPSWASPWGQPKVYTGETLGLVVSTSCLGALVLGFVMGFFCSRRWRRGYPDTCFLEQKHPVHRPQHQRWICRHPHLNTYETKLVNHSDPSYNNKNVNLLLNVPDRSDNSSSDSGSLHKVKKTYL